MAIVCCDGRKDGIVGSLSQLRDATGGAQNPVGSGCRVVHPTESAISILERHTWHGGLINSVPLLVCRCMDRKFSSTPRQR